MPESRAKREAIRYRQQLRETEAKLASVAALVVGQKIESLNVGVEALAAAGTKAADLFDSEGNFDDARLLAAVVATHEKFGVRQGNVLPGIIAGYEATGAVDWRPTPGGYVGSAGTTGEDRRPSFEEAKARAQARLNAQRTHAVPVGEEDYGQKWSDLLASTRNPDAPATPERMPFW